MFPANACGRIHQAVGNVPPEISGGKTKLALTADYTLTLLDWMEKIVCTNSGNIAITIPPASSVAYPPNFQMDIIRGGAGEVSFTPGAGVTLVSESSKRRINLQGQRAILYHEAGDGWYLYGDLKT